MLMNKFDCVCVPLIPSELPCARRPQSLLKLLVQTSLLEAVIRESIVSLFPFALLI